MLSPKLSRLFLVPTKHTSAVVTTAAPAALSSSSSARWQSRADVGISGGLKVTVTSTFSRGGDLRGGGVEEGRTWGGVRWEGVAGGGRGGDVDRLWLGMGMGMEMGWGWDGTWLVEFGDGELGLVFGRD